jgi:hypothetical protein
LVFLLLSKADCGNDFPQPAVKKVLADEDVGDSFHSYYNDDFLLRLRRSASYRQSAQNTKKRIFSVSLREFVVQFRSTECKQINAEKERKTMSPNIHSLFVLRQ